MATLLSICQDALKEIGAFAVPSAIISNTDPVAVQLLALANRSGRTLAKQHHWQVLLTTHTFSTANGTGTYALPSDFGSFSNLTQWNRSVYERMEGPVTPRVFEMLRSGNLAAVGGVQYFRVAANVFAIYPTPTAIETIAYQYYSTNWITGKKAFTDDADVPLLDSDLMTLDVRARFLKSKGLPAAEDAEADFRDHLAVVRGDDGGRDAIRFGAGSVKFADNIPDHGVGA